MNDSLTSVDIDREQLFMLFATFGGDLVRTSAASGVPAAAILKMCSEEGWHEKLAPILALKKSTKPGDLERGINRALNFVMAHKMRLIVQRAINRLTELTQVEFEEQLFQGSVDKAGNKTSKLTTRGLADLAVALEKAQALSYHALNDTAPERAKRKSDEGDDADISAGDLHARISAGLASVRASCTPQSQLLDAQLQQAAELAKQAIKPASPYDSGD